MWFRKKAAPSVQSGVIPESSVAIIEPEPQPEPEPEIIRVPTPVDVDAEVNEIVHEELSRVAGVLNYAPPTLLIARLKRFLKTEGLKIYPYENVTKFLNSQYREWLWRPLRAQDSFADGSSTADVINPADQSRLRLSGFAIVGHGRETGHGRENGDTLAWRPYTLPVPVNVLQVAEKVAAAVPQVRFYVSDIPRVTDGPPDPFLACLFDHSRERIVIAHWDEPSFGEL